MSIPRTAERKDMPADTRLLLAELDLDDHDSAIAELKATNGRILWALIGILISTTTAAIMLALNLAVGA